MEVLQFAHLEGGDILEYQLYVPLIGNQNFPQSYCTVQPQLAFSPHR